MAARGKNTYSAFSIALSFAFSLLAGMGIGFYGGRYLDARLGTEPFLTLFGVGLGVVAAFRILVRDLLRPDGTGRSGDRCGDA